MKKKLYQILSVVIPQYKNIIMIDSVITRNRLYGFKNTGSIKKESDMSRPSKHFIIYLLIFYLGRDPEGTYILKNPIILHDNASSYTAVAVTNFVRCWEWEILEHPTYSPDMSPSDYYLFAKVKEPQRGSRYNTRDELIRAIRRLIRNINKDGRLLMVYDAF